MSESLKGKVAIVTGAASGIGLATTKLLIEADVKVFMVDWDEKPFGKKLRILVKTQSLKSPIFWMLKVVLP